MSEKTRETALALCPHELRSLYALLHAAKKSLLDLSYCDANDLPGITDEVTKIEAYLSKGMDMMREIKAKTGVRE